MPDYLAQPNSTLSKDRTGICRIEVSYHIPGPAEAGGSEPYEDLESWLPAVAPMGLVATDRKATKGSDGDWDLVIGFEGAKADQALGAFAEIDYASVDSPVVEFDGWEELAIKWKANPLGENGEFQGWQPKIPDPVGGDTIKNPYLGFTHFVESNIVLRVTFGLRDFLPGLFVNCSKIESPLVPKGMKYLRELPEGQTWLKRTVKGAFRGNVWQFAIEYVAGKWKTDIYGPKKSDGLKDAINDNSSAAGSTVGNIA